MDVSKMPAYVVVDSQDPDRIAPFWRALLGVGVLENRDDGHYVSLQPASSARRDDADLPAGSRGEYE